MGEVIITKRASEEFADELEYVFTGVDGYGETVPLGKATQVEDAEGRPYFEGTFDTQPIGFADDAECERIVSRRKPNDEVTWGDVPREWFQMCQLEAYLGEFADEFDIDAIGR